SAPSAHACAQPRAGAAYAAQVDRVLRAGADLWGNELLRAPGGPTLAAASRYLSPLRSARTSHGRPLTASGVYYLPFAQPEGPQGAGSVALHVADGSEIYAGNTTGRSLTIFAGGERFGSCGARLADGWLPI